MLENSTAITGSWADRVPVPVLPNYTRNNQTISTSDVSSQDTIQPVFVPPPAQDSQGRLLVFICFRNLFVYSWICTYYYSNY